MSSTTLKIVVSPVWSYLMHKAVKFAAGSSRSRSRSSRSTSSCNPFFTLPVWPHPTIQQCLPALSVKWGVHYKVLIRLLHVRPLKSGPFTVVATGRYGLQPKAKAFACCNRVWPYWWHHGQVWIQPLLLTTAKIAAALTLCTWLAQVAQGLRTAHQVTWRALCMVYALTSVIYIYKRFTHIDILKDNSL